MDKWMKKMMEESAKKRAKLNAELVFQFKDDTIKNVIRRELQLQKRMAKSFDYIHAKLVELGHHVEGECPQVTKDLMSEGKSYNWVAITSGDIKFLIRTYGMHFTVFTRIDETNEFELSDGKKYVETERTYGAFYYHTKTDLIKKTDVIEGIPNPDDDVEYISDYYSDCMYDDPFHMWNVQMKSMLDLIKKRDGIGWLWNPVSFERPDFIEVKNIFEGKESIDTLDGIVFCAEELAQKHLELFAENDMLEAIKKFKKGDKFKGEYHSGTIQEVRTEVKDDYYHAVGLLIKKDGKTDFEDVYSLTHWDLKGVFPDSETYE